MARSVGISISSVQRIWKAHGLKPHQVRTFKLSKDPRSIGIENQKNYRATP